MTVYVIADIKVTDESWLSDYAAHVLDIVHRHGGRYLSRSTNVTTIEGEELDTTLVALLRFPSMDAVRAFAEDPDYAPSRKARRDGRGRPLCARPAPGQRSRFADRGPARGLALASPPRAGPAACKGGVQWHGPR